MPFFVMAKTVLKTIFRKPYTIKYPFGGLIERPKARGSIAIDIKECIFCGLCQRKCPTKALTVVKDRKEWAIDRLRCITCAACVESCPKKCLVMESRYSPPLVMRQEEVFKGA
ncbi:MAG: 4Fe-4S dicluster domain-containing protein [Candidatus Omnitrophota bacterium]|nr:4Fe-4S dicluster domain-containing protein [Candidatus Omnitrophota bacterium]